MRFSPHFAKASIEKYFTKKKVNCLIRDAKGEILFQQDNVEAPTHWSSLAIEIAASKYFRKVGVGSKNGNEKSVFQMIERVVDAIAKQGKKQGYFSSNKDLKHFANELQFILLDQRAFFNSPVWFNCGLSEAYGIRSSADQWAWNSRKKFPENIKDAYSRPQISACFIQSIDDSLDGIFNLAKIEAKLFKYGSGSGTNFSNLRSRYESLEGGGKSSGLISFLDVLDRGAGSVKSGGITRRAAKMVILDIDHPEIEEFVKWKSDEEKKAKALIAAGYSGDFEGPAYKTVSGQNANNSVRLSQKFLSALEANKDWDLLARTTGKKIKSLSAKDLWGAITQSAWECADPGLQFHENIQKYHTCKNSGDIEASNPCSEYFFLNDTACNLASINLTKFIDENGHFCQDDFLQTIRVMIVAQDILVDYAGYPTEKICQNSHDYRPLGLGFAGFGAFLMSLEIPYESTGGRQWASVLSSLLTSQSYVVSSEIAKELGGFQMFKRNKKSMLKVLQLHQSANNKMQISGAQKTLKETAQNLWSQVLRQGLQFGLRNSQVSVMAPTGTIGLVMDSDTTGIEPEFSLVKYKKFVGGQDLQMINQSFLRAMKKLNFSEEKIQQVLTHIQMAGSLRGSAVFTPEQEKIFACAHEISPEDHLLMMAAIQPFISGGISKTVNLPEQTGPGEIGEIYLRAWQLGLKSVAIYRDGCKSSQPLRKNESPLPTCTDCGSPTEFAGGCFRCINCGSVIGCA